MDRKSLGLFLASMAVLVTLFLLTNKIFPPVPVPPGTPADTNAPAAAAAGGAVTNGAAPASPAAAAAVVAAVPVVPSIPTNAPEQLVVLESPDARYTFTSRGGGLKEVELKQYPETVDCRNKSATNQLANLNGQGPAPVFAVRGPEALTGDQNYTLTRVGANTVVAEKILPGGLKLSREFTISSNFIVRAAVRYANTGAAPREIPAHALETGAATPMNSHDDETAMGLYWYDGSRSAHCDLAWFENRTLGCFPGTPRPLFAGGSNDVRWMAVHNQFFILAVIPPTNAPGARVSATRIDLPPPTPAEIAADKRRQQRPHAIVSALDQPGFTLGPGQQVVRSFDVYAGPKEFKTLSRMGDGLDAVMGFDGFFGFFAKILLLSMNGLHSLGLNYALAIIGITVIIKILFWPLTQASTRSMKRMQALQPQIKVIQEKYKEDPAKVQKKTMELFRENKVNPMGGCLPMLVQIPVFFGFFTMIRSAVELRGVPFLWACDLSKPDTIWIIPGLDFPLNPLPLLMAATQFWQTSMTPPSPGVDPAQQRLMRWMPLMFVFILYNYSAALTLYWTTQNLLSILQMKLTKTDPAEPAATPARVVPAGRKKK